MLKRAVPLLNTTRHQRINSYILCDRGDSGKATLCAKRGAQGKPVISDRDVKVCQILRERGDELTYQTGQLQVQITVDGFVREKKSSIPLPRCVGADKTFKKKPWETLNKLFKGDRVGQVGITFGRSKAEMAKCMLMWSRRPLFDNTGAALGDADYDEALKRVALPFRK